MNRRRTKIIATLGPATNSPEVLDRLIAAGMDGARINCSHGHPEDWRQLVREVRAAASRAGRPVAVLFDLQGPKLRLDASVPERQVVPGDEVLFARSGVDGAVPVVWPDLADSVTPGRSQILIGDGTPRFDVVAVEGERVRARCCVGGPLKPRKGFYVTFATRSAPALTEKDLADLEVALACDADYVALSFVRGVDDVLRLRGLLEAAGSAARLVAKVEKVEAIEHLTEIVAAADGVMAARGDLGVEVGTARVPLLQKQIIAAATADGKLAITATQMLESMTHSPEPTRAEATDVANAVLDGSSAVMLSAETATGMYPVEAVAAMAAIATDAQAGVPFSKDLAASVEGTMAESVMQAAVLLGRQIKAVALVVPTRSGGSVRAAAKYRPRRPIVAPCHHAHVARQLALEWGVVPSVMEDEPAAVFDVLEASLAEVYALEDVPLDGDVVITYGPASARPGATNLILVHRLGDPSEVASSRRLLGADTWRAHG